jgi:two-component system chemotaxis response regulator CheY
MKVLVVDDSKAMRLIVIRTLRQAGFDKLTIEEACSGKDALDRIKANAYDAILSDWNMPEMTGIQLLEALRAGGYRGRFAFVTSEASDEMKARAQTAGAHAYVTQPFTAELFQKSLGGLFA